MMFVSTKLPVCFPVYWFSLWFISALNFLSLYMENSSATVLSIAQSAGAVEYTDCTSAKG